MRVRLLLACLGLASFSVLSGAARGHAAYYLKWADEALVEGGEGYAGSGITQALRAAAASRDGALEPGTSELQKGTKKEGAEACPSAQR